MKSFIKIIKIDIKAIVRGSLTELFILMLFIFYPLLIKDNSESLFIMMILFIPLWSLAVINKGLTLSFLVNYLSSLNDLLVYVSVKYLVMSIGISFIILCIYGNFTNIKIINSFIGLIFLSILFIAVYFLLLFYFLKTTELDVISGVFLFILGSIIYYIVTSVIDRISYWYLLLILAIDIIYFKIIIPMYKKIVENRFEIIIGKFL
ncbi:hypothetical protein ABRY23_04580 [Melioribacteraceae bacterium 4301-Me]|uniref:hypothetical protein n=1 Tax=Pyranulibacter aquaticus TaxID=3163344 RepID=UPI00359B2866